MSNPSGTYEEWLESLTPDEKKKVREYLIEKGELPDEI